MWLKDCCQIQTNEIDDRYYVELGNCSFEATEDIDDAINQV